MHHVFVSYSRRDREWVRTLVDELRRSGQKAWIDQEDIQVSAPWIQEVADAVAEADLFLICDSPNWRSSQTCSAELHLAQAAEKRTFKVQVGRGVAAVRAEVATELERQPLDYRMRTELSTLARDWDRSSRPGGALVSRRRARQLRTADSIGPVGQAFLGASAARARRRTIVAGAGLLTAIVALGSFLVIRAAENKINAENDVQATLYMRNEQLREAVPYEPIQALSIASHLGDNESAANAFFISRAFEHPLPDDAFKVPSAARWFARHIVGEDVTVLSGDGRAWGRLANARSVRTAAAEVESRPKPGRRTQDSVGRVQARVAPEAGRVDVFRSGILYRRIYVGRRPDAVAVSPNGRELAVANGNGIDVVDIAVGRDRLSLRSGAGAILDIAWSQDGDRVWALSSSPSLVMSWRVRDGEVLVDDPRRRFEAVLPSNQPGRFWVITSTGHLRELDSRTGRTVRSLHVPAAITSAGADPHGEVAALSGKRAVWIVRLAMGSNSAPRKIALHTCLPGRPVFEETTSFRLPCIGGDVLTIATRTGEVVNRLSVSRAGAFAVRFLSRGVLLVSDEAAGLYVVPPGGQASEIFRPLCGGSITRIAVGGNGRTVVPAGAGAGLPSCLPRMQLVGSDPAAPSSWRADSILDSGSTSVVAEASAVSPGGGVFAYGYNDGMITVHPTANLVPERVISGVVGEIRDMLITPRDQLIVVTSAGVVQRIQLCERCLSNRSLAKVAFRILDRALVIGVAKRTGTPG